MTTASKCTEPLREAGRIRSLGLGASAILPSSVVQVELTPHLFQFFPHLKGKELRVEASSAAEVVREMEKLAPGFAFYVCDERGRLRPHVNLFIEDERVLDRTQLTDRLKPDSRVFILQALSGG